MRPVWRFRLVKRVFAGTIAVLAWTAVACSPAAGDDPLSTQAVGPADGGMIVPTGQLIRPAGETHAFFGRPTDIVVGPGGTLVFVKLTSELMIVDAKSWKVVQDLPYPVKEEGSMHGLAVSKDGKQVFVTGSTKYLLEARCNGRGDWNWQPPIALAAGKVHLTGIALSRRWQIGLRLHLDCELPDGCRSRVRQDPGHGSHGRLPIRRCFEP